MCLFLVAVLGYTPLSSALDANVLNRTKQATVLVVCDETTGTGFCISTAQGIFVTNAHVIAGSSKIQLVINSGSSDSKVVDARVIRASEHNDLAILAAESEVSVPALELGSVEDIIETLPVTAFGYPFGMALGAGGYPSISVNTGHVTSLRRSGDSLNTIQIDAAVYPGNSGGPVISEEGKVLGVIVAGLEFTQVNFCIPVSTVLGFLKKPVIEMSPDENDAIDFTKAVTFDIRVTTIGPTPPTYKVVLSLSGQRFEAISKGGGNYSVKVRPDQLDVPGFQNLLTAAMTKQDGTIVYGLVQDRQLQIGNARTALKSIRRIDFTSPPTLTGTNGKTISSRIGGLEPFEALINGVKTPVPMGSLKSMTLTQEQAAQPGMQRPIPTYGIVVHHGAQFIARRQGIFSRPSAPGIRPSVIPTRTTEAATSVNDPGAFIPPPADLSSILELKPLHELTEKREIAFNSPVGSVAVGGHGRYLVLQFPFDREIKIFDIATLEWLSHTIPVGSDKVVVTAGADRVVLIDLSTSTIARYSFNAATPIAATAFPWKATPLDMSLGRSASRIAAVSFQGSIIDTPPVQFFDTESMKALDFPKPQISGYLDNVRIRSSAHGRVFTFAETVSSAPSTAILSEGAILYSRPDGSYDHDAWEIPSLDGTYLLSGGTASAINLFGDRVAPLQNSLESRSNSDNEVAICLPSAHPSYYVRATFPKSSYRPIEGLPNLSVIPTGRNLPIAMLAETLDELATAVTRNDAKDAIAIDQRIHLVPQLNALITIPEENDRMVIRPFHL
ncbi:MAG: serine protease, partial [Verrucomicrobiota bacterium]